MKRFLPLILLALMLAGCSTPGAYQGFRQSQSYACDNIPDEGDREACKQDSKTKFYIYEMQREKIGQ